MHTFFDGSAGRGRRKRIEFLLSLILHKIMEGAVPAPSLYPLLSLCNIFVLLFLRLSRLGASKLTGASRRIKPPETLELSIILVVYPDNETPWDSFVFPITTYLPERHPVPWQVVRLVYYDLVISVFRNTSRKVCRGISVTDGSAGFLKKGIVVLLRSCLTLPLKVLVQSPVCCNHLQCQPARSEP